MQVADRYWPYLYKQRNKERVCQMMICIGYTCTKKEIKSLCVSKVKCVLVADMYWLYLYKERDKELRFNCKLVTHIDYTCTKRKRLCVSVGDIYLLHLYK